MVYRRPAAKRMVRKKRVFRKRAVRFVRKMPNTMMQVKRTCYSSNWTMAPGVLANFWRYYTFTTGDVTNFAEFAAVFDEYRIAAIKVTFRPSYDNINVVDGATAPQAYAHVIVDPESTLVPSGIYGAGNLNAFLENEGLRTYTLNRPFSIYLKPKCSDSIFGGGTAARTYRAPWIKTTETGVQHRGFHVYLQQNSFSSGNANVKLDTFYTFYLQFRNVK